MSHFEATIAWQRGEQKFIDNRYSRAHEWAFDGGARVPASSSPLFVPLPMSDAANVDPEEALVAATSNCHMLWFLSIAAKRGSTVDQYTDRAFGVLGKNSDNRIALARITLRPQAVFPARSNRRLSNSMRSIIKRTSSAPLPIRSGPRSWSSVPDFLY